LALRGRVSRNDIKERKHEEHKGAAAPILGTSETLAGHAAHPLSFPL
jgi:hypothetical protein